MNFIAIEPNQVDSNIKTIMNRQQNNFFTVRVKIIKFDHLSQ